MKQNKSYRQITNVQAERNTQLTEDWRVSMVNQISLTLMMSMLQQILAILLILIHASFLIYYI